MCPDCRLAIGNCSCASKGAAARVPTPVAVPGIVRVGRESKGRAGKTVTLVRGLALESDALSALGRQLRTACGAGGALKDGVLELQGDHVERVAGILRTLGHTVRRSGG
jgi:translation initiation factor 1